MTRVQCNPDLDTHDPVGLMMAVARHADAMLHPAEYPADKVAAEALRFIDLCLRDCGHLEANLRLQQIATTVGRVLCDAIIAIRKVLDASMLLAPMPQRPGDDIEEPSK